MELLHTFFLVIGIANFAGGLLSVFSWPFIRKRYKEGKKVDKGEYATIIIPFKGKNIDNLHFFFEQDYERYEVILVVDTENEANFLKKKFKNARIEITEKLPSCSGKISALLTGIKKAKGNIYVFADADIKPNKEWLSYLIGGLNKNIATSYRWYFKNALLSVWNASVAAIMFYNAFNFAWGGATAIKKDVFEEIGIENIWRKEVVDDLTLTMAAKKRYGIKFIPQAMAPSDEEINIFSWMNKEMAWVRYYFPSLWKIAFFINIGMRASNIAGFILLFFYPLVGFLLISPILFDFLRGWQEYHTFANLTMLPKEKFISPFLHSIYRPLISFIISYNLISSAFIKEIEWGGRKYVIKH